MSTSRTPTPETLLADLRAVIDSLEVQHSRIKENEEMKHVVALVVPAFRQAGGALLQLTKDVRQLVKQQRPPKPSKKAIDPHSPRASIERAAATRKKRKS